MSRDPHKDDKKQPPNQQPQAAIGHSAWELNRLSPTGRNFLLEPDSRTSIVQELQMRLRREQQRREHMLLLSSLNNAAQDQSATAAQEADADAPLPRQQLGDKDQEVPVIPSRYNDALEPVVTQRNSSKKLSTFDSSSPGLELEPATIQQAMATDSAPAVATDSPQRKSLQPPIYSAKDPAEQEFAIPAKSSFLTEAKDQESPAAYRNDSPSEDNRYEQSAISTQAVSSYTGEKANPTASWPTLRSMKQVADSSPPGVSSSSTQRNSVRSETSLTSKPRNDGSMPAMETSADRSESSASLAPVDEDSTENGSLLPMRRNSARSTHSTTVPAAESAWSAPMPSPMRNSIRSEAHTPGTEVPKAAGENARSSLSARRDSIRSATTQTPADAQSEKKPTQIQSQPLRTSPCLQCLMRCLQDSGLLGSCWKAAVFELEEAFAIREVADAAIGKSVGGAGGESIQQRLPTQNRGSASGENSTVESPSQFEVNKWQALERLCHLRNSLRTCSHQSDA